MPVSEGLKIGLNKIREISSDIYHRYIPVIEDDTDIGAFSNPILNYPEVYDEFVKSLLYKLTYVQFESKYFRNPLKQLEGDKIPLGYAGQGIYVNPAKGRKFNPEDFAGILAKYESDVKVEYYALNMDTQYPVSIQRQILKKAFSSWGELESFIDQLSNSLYNGAYIDEYRFTKEIVSSAYKDNKAIVETVSAVTDEATAKAFVEKARTLFLNFQSPSSNYNAWHKMGGAGAPITTWSNPEDIVILIRNDIRAKLDVNVLAESFNMDKADLLGRIIPVDNWDILSDEGTKVFDGSNIIGIIADRSWFKIKTQDMFLDVDYNPSNRTYQYFLNNIKQYQYSLFANGVIIATSNPSVPATDLDFVEGNPTKVAPNKSIILEVETKPVNESSTITFSSGTTEVATVTKIDDRRVRVNGVSAGTSVITATDGTYSDTLTVTCAEPEIAITGLTPEVATVTLAAAATEDLTVTVAPSGGNTPIYYTSSNTSVFTVAKSATANNECTITGVGAGSASLFITTGAVTALVTVTVTGG